MENCPTSQILFQFLKTEDPGKKFLTFLDFFPGSALKIFSWDLRRKIFYWPQIIQTFTRWIIPFQKIQTQNIKEFWKAHGILLPMGLGLPWKILHQLFCPKIFSWLLHMCSDSPKIVVQKNSVKFFRVALYVEVNSKMGFLKRAKKETFRYF